MTMPSRAKSKPKSKSKSTASKKRKGRSLSTVEIENLPAIRVDGLTIEKYDVVSQPNHIGKVAHYGVLAWTPETYDYERNESITSKLYIFPTEGQRDDFQQTLYDEAPNLYLQSFRFQNPISIRSRFASR